MHHISQLFYQSCVELRLVANQQALQTFVGIHHQSSCLRHAHIAQIILISSHIM